MKTRYRDGSDGYYYLNLNEKIYEKRGPEDGGDCDRPIHRLPTLPLPAPAVQPISTTPALSVRRKCLRPKPAAMKCVEERRETMVSAPLATPAHLAEDPSGSTEIAAGAAAPLTPATHARQPEAGSSREEPTAETGGYANNGEASVAEVEDLVTAIGLIDVNERPVHDGDERIGNADVQADATHIEAAMRYSLIQKVVLLPPGQLLAALEALESLVVDEETV